MKAELEPTSIQYRGVVLVSQTEEEKRVLEAVKILTGPTFPVRRLR